MSKKSPGDSPAAELQAQLAQQLFSQTDPLRRSLIDRSTEFMGGGLDVRDTPAYEALKYSADANFNQAKDNAIARLAPGGGLTDALVDLESNRAGMLTQGAGQLYGDELSRAIALGSGITDQSLNSLGQAGGVQASLANAQAQQNAGKAQGLGAAAGAAAGGK